MSADLMPFAYEGAELRSFVIDGEPWFVARDICNAIGLPNLTMALQRLAAADRTAWNEGDQRMSRFECLRHAGLLAFHSLMASATFALLVWIPYLSGWLRADQFRVGLLVALLLFAGGCGAAVVIAVVALAVRDRS